MNQHVRPLACQPAVSVKTASLYKDCKSLYSCKSLYRLRDPKSVQIHQNMMCTALLCTVQRPKPKTRNFSFAFFLKYRLRPSSQQLSTQNPSGNQRGRSSNPCNNTTAPWCASCQSLAYASTNTTIVQCFDCLWRSIRKFWNRLLSTNCRSRSVTDT